MVKNALSISIKYYLIDVNKSIYNNYLLADYLSMLILSNSLIIDLKGVKFVNARTMYNLLSRPATITETLIAYSSIACVQIKSS